MTPRRALLTAALAAAAFAPAPAVASCHSCVVLPVDCHPQCDVVYDVLHALPLPDGESGHD